MRALVAVAIILAAVPVRADKNERIEIVARIDDAVHAIATALDGEPDLDEALLQSQHIRELVTQLASSTGVHPRAADIIAHYRAYADTFDAAATILKRMRQASHSTDGVLARCIKADAELSAAIDKVKAHPDPDPARDLANLSARGDSFGTSWSATLANLVAVDQAITADVAASHLALTDGYWMSVSSQVDVAAHAIANAWTERYQPVTGACDPLGRGQNHPQLAPVLDDLRKQVGANRSTARQLIHDYNAWLGSVRHLRDLAVKARDDIRGAICGSTDLELESRVENVADASARELVDEAGATAAEAGRLRARATKAPAAIVTGLRTTIPTTVERGEARGRQSPKLRALLAATTQRRADTVRGLGCAYENIGLGAVDCSAGTCKIPCVKVVARSCTVVEIVPDNDRAKGDATTSADRDLRGLRAWYSHDRGGLFARYPNLRKCENDDKSELDVTTAVVTYPACTKLAATDLGDVLPDLPPTLAE